MGQGAADRMRGRVVIDLDIPYLTTEERVSEAVREGLRQELSTMVAASARIVVKLVMAGEAGTAQDDATEAPHV